MYVALPLDLHGHAAVDVGRASNAVSSIHSQGRGHIVGDLKINDALRHTVLHVM